MGLLGSSVFYGTNFNTLDAEAAFVSRVHFHRCNFSRSKKKNPLTSNGANFYYSNSLVPTNCSSSRSLCPTQCFFSLCLFLFVYLFLVSFKTIILPVGCSLPKEIAESLSYARYSFIYCVCSIYMGYAVKTLFSYRNNWKQASGRRGDFFY